MLYQERQLGVPRQQYPHRRSGLATLPSVGAIPKSPHISVDSVIAYCTFHFFVYFCSFGTLMLLVWYFDL